MTLVSYKISGILRDWKLENALHKKLKFFVKDFFINCDQICTFTEEILNGKLHYLCSDYQTLVSCQH